MRQVRVRRLGGQGRQVEQPLVQPGERTASSHVQEDRILERIGASKCDRPGTRTRDRLDDRLGKLFEPRSADLVRLTRVFDDKPQFLKHDVQEMIGVQANARELS